MKNIQHTEGGPLKVSNSKVAPLWPRGHMFKI